MPEPFYVADPAAAPKPFVHPVTTPGGVELSTVSPPDHAWHRGLWFTFKFVDGDNFWEEDHAIGFGRQIHVSATALEWRRPDGSVAITETRSVERAPSAPAGSIVIDWTTSLTAVTDVVLDRTPYTTWGGYGGLTFRGRSDWSDTRVLLDDGSTQRRPEGIPSRWADLSGPTAGVAFLDHPSNLRHPVRWYGASRSRVYGEGWSNFLNAALLFAEPLLLGARETLDLRYRVIAHDGEWSRDEVDDAWSAWVGRAP